MPDGAQRAVEAVSNPTRLLTIWYLADHPGSTPREIITNTSASTVYLVLPELERLRFVTADLPAGARHGREVHYTLDAVAFAGALAELQRWIGDLSGI